MDLFVEFRAPSRHGVGRIMIAWDNGPDAWPRGDLFLGERDLIALHKGGTVADIYRRFETRSDGLFVCDLDAVLGSSRRSGEATVRFVTLPIPHAVLPALRRWARAVWAAQERAIAALEADGAGYDAVRAAGTVRVDLAPYVERWERDYGQGKGAAVMLADDRTVAMLEAARALGGNLEGRLDQLANIARNRTTARWERAEWRLHRDSGDLADPCFTFKVGGMFGGLVNHAPAGAPGDWSLHT